MQLSVDYIGNAHTPVELATSHQLRQRYGTVRATMLTLFHTISGGDWWHASESVASVNWGFRYLFALYIFIMMFGMLNVIIGLFCEKASGAVESDRDLRRQLPTASLLK